MNHKVQASAAGGCDVGVGNDGSAPLDESSDTRWSPEDNPSSLCYRPLERSLIQLQAQLYEDCWAEMDDAWRDEVARYEETIPYINTEANHHTMQQQPKQIPRRNYFHPSGKVQDPALFPYHDSCYPLLDAYDRLYQREFEEDDDDEDNDGNEHFHPYEDQHPIRSCPKPARLSAVQNEEKEEDRVDDANAVDAVNEEENYGSDDEDNDNEGDDEVMPVYGDIDYDCLPSSLQAILMSQYNGTPPSDSPAPSVDRHYFRCWLDASGRHQIDSLLVCEDCSGNDDTHNTIRRQRSGKTCLERKLSGSSAMSESYWLESALEPLPHSSSPVPPHSSSISGLTTPTIVSPTAAGTKLHKTEASRTDQGQNGTSVQKVGCYGPCHFPSGRTARAHLLLRLLRHALSDFQRDHRLAQAVLVTLMRFHDLDDVVQLRRLLAIVDAEYLACRDPCEPESPESHHHHNCANWLFFVRGILPMILSLGLTYLTRDHAACMVAFVQTTFWKEFGHLLRGISDGASINDKRKTLLKRTILLRNTEESDGDYVDAGAGARDRIVQAIVVALGDRALLERRRLDRYIAQTKKHPDDQNAIDWNVSATERRTKTIARCLDSFYNAVAALVEIGELAVQVLPTGERFYGICSNVVKSLAQALANVAPRPVQFSMTWGAVSAAGSSSSSTASAAREDVDPVADTAAETNGDHVRWGGGVALNTDYRGAQDTAVGGYSLVNPLRYADFVLGPTPQHRARRRKKKQWVPPKQLLQQQQQQQSPANHSHEHKNTQNNLAAKLQLVIRAADSILEDEPPQAVLEVVKHLFLREMVDVREASLGYGDFLLWCGFEVTPLDPLLFCSDYNFPVEETGSDDDDDNEMDDDEEEPSNWDIDEDGVMLPTNHLRARNDFALMLLVQAWHGVPWTPNTHSTFSTSFRQGLNTLALVFHRRGMPNVLLPRIAAFLGRDGWPEERKQCWHFECQTEYMARINRRKILARFEKAITTGTTPTTAVSNENIAAAVSTYHNRYADCEYCQRCHVAIYCSKECRDKDDKAIGHRRSCCRPPLRFNHTDDIEFCKDVLGDELPAALRLGVDEGSVMPSLVSPMKAGNNNNDDMVMDNDVQLDDDEGSWESIDTDGDDDGANGNPALTRTQQIVNYFEKHTYKHES